MPDTSNLGTSFISSQIWTNDSKAVGRVRSAIEITRRIRKDRENLARLQE